MLQKGGCAQHCLVSTAAPLGASASHRHSGASLYPPDLMTFSQWSTSRCIILPITPVVTLSTLLAEQGRQAGASGEAGRTCKEPGSCRHWGCSCSSGRAASPPLGADPAHTDRAQLQGLFSGAYIRLQTDVAVAEGVHGAAHAQRCE